MDIDEQPLLNRLPSNLEIHAEHMETNRTKHQRNQTGIVRDVHEELHRHLEEKLYK